MKYYVVNFNNGALCRHGEFEDINEALKWVINEFEWGTYILTEYESEKEYYKILD